MEKQTYKPEISTRNSEYVAWGLAVASIFAVIVLNNQGNVPTWAWFLTGLFIFSGIVISFGNWVDRMTMIEMDEETIHFVNGLRNVTMKWDEILYLWEGKGRIGYMVQVLAADRHFSFNLPSEMSFQGRGKSKVGFKEGETIRDEIMRRAKLDFEREHKDGKVFTREEADRL